MATRPGSTALRRQLGAELRRIRTAAQRSPADVRTRLGWSESKLSRIETGVVGIHTNDLERLADYYDLDEPTRARLRAMADQTRRRAWWEAYGDALPDAYQTFIGFEAEATAIYNYEAQLVPGLLQTAEYTNAVTQASLALDPELVAERVRIRMARQAVFIRENPPRLSAIVDEAALRRPVGGPEVLRRQLLRLVEASEHPMITIQVLPFTAGAHRALEGSFVVLEFSDGPEASLVYSEGMTGGVFRHKPEDVRTYTMSFEALRSAAMSPDASIEFIRAVAAGDG